MSECDPIVGSGCTTDGQRVPITKSMADAIFAQVEADKAERIKLMPTEKDAIQMLNKAVTRLKELGWNDPIYCPKDGSAFDVVEAGSSGIHKCTYNGEWPKGSWWVHDDVDSYPSRPVLYRRTDAEILAQEKFKKRAHKFRTNKPA